MPTRLALFAVVVAVLPSMSAQSPALFDPVGKWTISTTTDTGQPVKVAVQIAGKVGAYTGHAISPEGQTLPLRDLATTPQGMIAIFDLPQGAIICRMVREADGKYAGAWGQVQTTYALTATREK